MSSPPARLGLILLIIGLCLAEDSSLARPRYTYAHYNYGIDRSLIAKRQSTDGVVVTGVHNGNSLNGSLPLRLEIRNLEKNQDAWTLYILGLDLLQYIPQTEKLSWYQIAGIHGRPYATFDDVQPAKGSENNGFSHDLIGQIARQYPTDPDREKYIAAAQNFRIPYWDWAAVTPTNGSLLPRSIQVPAIEVNGPNGKQWIKNPLFSYQFDPLNTTDIPHDPFRFYTDTKRDPSSRNASAHSQHSLIEERLSRNAASTRERLYNLFTNYHDYTSFSNQALPPPPFTQNFDSIEALHNDIHGVVGNSGHMSTIDYSAFDPIFFLHHAMVDRCFAMWQVINPDSYVVPSFAVSATFTTAVGDFLGASTPLTPFRSDGLGSFWTSTLARYSSNFGYAYPETNNYTGMDTTLQIIKAVNQLYGKESVDQQTFVKRENSAPKHFAWVANIEVKKKALQHPFFIHIFLGDITSQPESWSLDVNLVGTRSVFTKASAAKPNCTCETELVVAGSISLTNALLLKFRNGELSCLDPGEVVPYIQKNLKYRILSMDSASGLRAIAPGLKITVASAEVRAAKSEMEFPEWGELRSHLNVEI